MNDDTGKFIFPEHEFNNENFSAAAFVVKYQRVLSLEALKDQLHKYCGNLKDKLYAIINEEYREFITITTKLEGVDQRVDMLRQPLVGLRLDLTTLHDGMMDSIKTVEEKLVEKSYVTQRKHMIGSFLRCLKQLDAADGVLRGVDNSKG